MDLESQLESLVRRCQGGERAAFETLFELYQPRLKYYLRRLDGDATADDLTQEVWLTVFRKIRQLKTPRTFPVWLYTIARNRVYGGRRQAERTVRLPEDAEVPEPVDEPDFTPEEAERMHRAMGSLRPPHREVLTLRFLEQMPYESIAEVVGCSAGTIRTRVFYAKQALRKAMEIDNG